ncbi:MAG: GNAT family N-acetyltransferase [Corynebacterium sp.]|uniref:GNAT family N-acetyltransferase n=1 Tax=Corynebacterium sp. TaxID=1720 RepID=UPI003F956507
MSGREFTVRSAVGSDAPGISQVHVTAWKETYGPMLPEGALDDMDEDERAGRWAEIIRDGKDVLVAEDGSGIVAWASRGEGRDEAAPVHLELEGIYSLARVHGTGVGQALCDAAIGDAAAYLWVLEGNDRAEAFYRRNGFRRDGEEKEHSLAGHVGTTVRMVRRKP